MKKLCLTMLLFACSLAHGAANDMIFKKRNAINNGQAEAVYASPSTPGFLLYDTSAGDVIWVTMGNNVSLSGNILSVGLVYVETVSKINVGWVIKSATTVSGQAEFHLTDDGLSSGNALCQEIIEDGIHLTVNDQLSNYQFGWGPLANSGKTLVVDVNKLSGANLSTGALEQSAAPDGTVVKLAVPCVL